MRHAKCCRKPGSRLIGFNYPGLIPVLMIVMAFIGGNGARGKWIVDVKTDEGGE